MLKGKNHKDDDYDDFLEEAVREHKRKVFLRKLITVFIVGMTLFGIAFYADIEYGQPQSQVVEAAQNNQ